MPAAPPCPPPAALERWLVGRVAADHADEIEQHVGTCHRCATTLRSLTPADALAAALRPAPGPDETPLPARAATLIPRLKQLRPQDSTAAWGDAPAGDTTQESGSVPPVSPLREPGGRVGGYTLLAPIGAGGMGVVFRAEDPVLRRTVALKLIQPALVRSAAVRERFLREAQALAQLEHDHVVTVYQGGEDDGVLFLAMPLLRGRTLQERIEEAVGPLPVDEILRVGREIAAGLAAAHARGIVHRDIKPGNVWLASEMRNAECGMRNEDPSRADSSVSNSAFRIPHSALQERVKILDFGLAQALTAEAGAGEAPGTVLGTPAYMAPEQAAGAAVDGRADLFSLGCVLYQMATGRRPFTAPNVVALIFAVATDEPTPVAERNPAVPPALAALVTALLRKNPADRPPSADVVAAELAAIEEARRPTFSRRKWAAGTAAAVLVAATVAVFAARTPPTPPPTPGEVAFDYPEADGRVALRLGDEPEQTFDLKATPVVTLPPGDYAVRALAATGALRAWPDRVVVTDGAKSAVALRLVGLVAERKSHAPHPVGGLAVREGGDRLTVFSAGYDRTLVAWNPASPDRPPQLLHPAGVFKCLALSPDGTALAAGVGDGGAKGVRAVRFYDPDTLQALPGELRAKDGGVIAAVAYSPDGRFLFVGESGGAVSRWDVRFRFSEEEQSHCDRGVLAVALAQDGTHVFTAGGDGTVAAWAAADLKPVRTYAAAKGPTRGVVTLPGGKQFAAAGDDKTVRVWDRATGAVVAEWVVPDAVVALAASPDGGRLVTGGADGVRVWDVARRQELVHFPLAGKVTCVVVTRDGRRVVSGAADGAVRVWAVPH